MPDNSRRLRYTFGNWRGQNFGTAYDVLRAIERAHFQEATQQRAEIDMPTIATTTPADAVFEARRNLVNAWANCDSRGRFAELNSRPDRFDVPQSAYWNALATYGAATEARRFQRQAHRAAGFSMKRIRRLLKLLQDPLWPTRRSTSTMSELRQMWLQSLDFRSQFGGTSRSVTRIAQGFRLIAWLKKMGALDAFESCSDCGTPVPMTTDGNVGWGAPVLRRNGAGGIACHTCLRDSYITGSPLAPGPEWRVHVAYRRTNESLIRNYSFDVLSVLEPEAHDGEKNPFFMGVELEVALRERGAAHSTLLGAADQLQELLPHCIFKSDGSIGQDGWMGFEIVSVPATLRKHQELWYDAFINPVMNKFHGAPTCGMHVHLDRNWIEPLTLGKLIMFYNKSQMYNLLHAIGGRSVLPGHARWCKADASRKGSDVFKRDGDRYRSLNLTKGVTAEIRIYASTTDYATFMSRIELSHASVMFCRDASLRRIDPASFLAWLDKASDAYPYLAAVCNQKRNSLI